MPLKRKGNTSKSRKTKSLSDNGNIDLSRVYPSEKFFYRAGKDTILQEIVGPVNEKYLFTIYINNQLQNREILDTAAKNILLQSWDITKKVFNGRIWKEGEKLNNNSMKYLSQSGGYCFNLMDSELNFRAQKLDYILIRTPQKTNKAALYSVIKESDKLPVIEPQILGTFKDELTRKFNNDCNIRTILNSLGEDCFDELQSSLQCGNSNPSSSSPRNPRNPGNPGNPFSKNAPISALNEYLSRNSTNREINAGLRLEKR